MEKFYLTSSGIYYTGDSRHALDVEVPERPAATATWDGDRWVLNVKADTNSAIDAQIVALEVAAGGYNRGFRESMMIIMLELKALGRPDYSVTPGMKKIKDLDDAIKVLRSQRVS